MSGAPPGPDSTFGERLDHAIRQEQRTPTNTESALMLKHPDAFKHRGFISSYRSGRRGRRADASKVSLIAAFLHVELDWLLLGQGPMRRANRAETPFEEAIKVARTWGIREDATQIAWERNKDRAATMTVRECFAAIELEAARLDREGIPRPELEADTIDNRGRVRRQKAKLEKLRKKGGNDVQTPDPEALRPRRHRAAGNGG